MALRWGHLKNVLVPFYQKAVRNLVADETGAMTLARFNTVWGYLAVYVAAVALGRMAVIEDTGLAIFWPAAGVAALWMLRGRNMQQVVLDAALLFASTTLVFMLLDKSPGVSMLFGATNLVQGFVVRLISARLKRLPLTASLTPGLTSTRDLLELSAASVLGAMLSDVFGVAAVRLMGDHVSWGVVIGWVVRNSCGTFVVVAVVLTIMAERRERTGRPHSRMLTSEQRPHATLEFVAALAVTVCAGILVFGASDRLPIAYVMIATSAWIGFRFSPLVGAVYSLGFGTLSLLFTLAGWGPFGAVDDLASRALVAQLFVAVTAVIVLMLAFGVSERAALSACLRASQVEATERADLLDAVTRVMTDGLTVVGADGKVVLSNPAAARMIGIGATPHVGTPMAHGVFRLDGSELPQRETPRARALRGEFVPPTDLLRIDPQTGQQTVLSISAAPLHPSTSEAAAMAVIVSSDVTKSRAQRRELENFAGVVAHDLKTPLTGVISWAEILEEQLTDSAIAGGVAMHASIRRIRSSAGRMAHLISDLLAYTQAQNAELSMQSVSLDAIVDQISQDLCDTHHLEIPVVEHAPLGRVLADPTLVRQLLTNLIGNAVKYVAPGIIPHLVIGSAPTEEMLEIWVSDNGIGIPDTDLGRVFDSFFRASSAQDYQGTGLGLAICARTIERHGGRISARKGHKGEGTTITFTLPLDPNPPLPAGDHPEHAPLNATP